MMTPERWSQIKDIFVVVMDRPAEQRQSVLVEACQGDLELQAELRQLLAQHDEMGQGETLAARLTRVGRIGPQEAHSIAFQLCQALGAAHRAGSLHRDFKCGNVMLIGSGEEVRAVVTDFGIARWMRSVEDSTGVLTTHGG